MNIDHSNFLRAASSEGLSLETAHALWAKLEKQAAVEESAASIKPSFDATHFFYYFGAMLVFGAFAWFMTEAWDAFGGFGLSAISLGYCSVFFCVGNALWKREWRTPGGLLVTLAVCMTPLFVYGLQRGMGWWPDKDPGSYTNYHPIINGSWIVMEIATVLVGVLVLRRWRFPFIVAPIAHALWFMSMDLVDLLLHGSWSEWDHRLVLTACFGVLMLLAGYLTDVRSKKDDFAFWLYLFGLLALSGSLSSMHSGSELKALLFGLLHLGFMAVAILLHRRTFMVFGALGVLGYLGHLAHKVFDDSIMFPFALGFIGLAIMVFGIWYQKNHTSIANAIQRSLPESIRRSLPPKRS